MYRGQEAAGAEVVAAKINQVLYAIGDDGRTRHHFLSEVRTCATYSAKLLYCRNFFIDLEKHREWAAKNLWFMAEIHRRIR